MLDILIVNSQMQLLMVIKFRVWMEMKQFTDGLELEDPKLHIGEKNKKEERLVFMEYK